MGLSSDESHANLETAEGDTPPVENVNEGGWPEDEVVDLAYSGLPCELSEPEGDCSKGVSRFFKSGASHLGSAGRLALDTARSGVVAAIITGVRMVSAERDRDEIIRWFVNAREILADGRSTSETSKALYRSIDTIRFARLLVNTVSTSISNYRGANLPLSLKVAMPVTAVGAAYFGTKYAGLVAMGGGIGLPVVLLLFLGTAGATAVVEGFIKDRSIRDPLTKLLLAFVAIETARQAKKELLQAMRADAMVPERAETPEEAVALLDFLMQMDPIAFERHVMSFFEKSGYPTGLTARSNDFGVDGYVFHPDGIVIVQCKRYSEDNAVGRPAIQQFKGVIEEQRAFRGYFVTTSRFTGEAAESAAKSDRIHLVDGRELIRWHKDGMTLK
jgi:restriction system protein